VFEQGEIKILNQLGAVTDVVPVNNKTTQYIYHNEKLSAGIYYYLLLINNKVTAGGKLIAE
jgi:hypothetical protein